MKSFSIEMKGKLFLIVFTDNHRTFNYLGYIACFLYNIINSDCYLTTANFLPRLFFWFLLGFNMVLKRLVAVYKVSSRDPITIKKKE